MGFIESWFGISPDRGDGSLEMLYVVLVLVVAAGFVVATMKLRAKVSDCIRRRD
jgi:hypothetical protein